MSDTAETQFRISQKPCSWASHLGHPTILGPMGRPCEVRTESEGEPTVAQSPMRTSPNILITGTPGTGKTATSALAAAATGLRHVCVGDVVREKSLHDGWDEEYQSFILNEDKLCDDLEDVLQPGGVIVDYHACDFFPERWFDLVVVLQADNSVLHDRLTARGYAGKKLEDNMECEIMQVLLEEARESYAEDVVIALKSDVPTDLEQNVERIKQWVEEWRNEHQ